MRFAQGNFSRESLNEKFNLSSPVTLSNVILYIGMTECEKKSKYIYIYVKFV